MQKTRLLAASRRNGECMYMLGMSVVLQVFLIHASGIQAPLAWNKVDMSQTGLKIQG